MPDPAPPSTPSPPAPTPIPALGPAPTAEDARRPRTGLHLRRIGGAPAWTPAGSWPRCSGLVAVRGVSWFRRPVRRIAVLWRGRVLAEGAPAVIGRDAEGRVKQVFNLWLDLSALPPGVQRLVVRPSGPLGRWWQRGRRVVVEAPGPMLPGSDASLPPPAGPDPAAAVAALPSVARPAGRAAVAGPVRSILVVRADQLGDLAISVPAVRRLRELFPQARLTALLTADNAELGAACGLFDAIVVAPFAEDPALDRRALPADDQARLAARLAAERFDVALDLGEGAQSRLLLLLAGARFCYGFRHGDHGWLSASFELNARDPADGLEVVPPARKLLAMVEALGAMAAPPPAPLPLPPDPARLAAAGIAPGEGFVLLHAGARLAHSRWPHFAALARLVLERTELKVLLFAHGDPADVPSGLPAVQADRLCVIEGRLPFAEFDALLAAAAVMVGNDSGPKHLAALRGTPVVSLHMARLNWDEWGQEGAGVILSRRVPCAGCGIGADGAECGRGHVCLTGITAEEAYAAVAGLL